MIKEAITALDGRCTRAQIIKYVTQHYPEINTLTLTTQITVCVVNHQSRVHYPENQRPRVCDDERYDFMFAVERGVYELYDPKKHGLWQIVRENGHSTVARMDQASDIGAASTMSLQASSRAQLIGLVVSNLPVMEAGVTTYGEVDGQGVSFRTDIGDIDLLCVDSQGRLVVIEIVADEPTEVACGRLLQKTGWVKTHMDNGKTVRGVILTPTADDGLSYVAAIPNVQVYRFRVSLAFDPVGAKGRDAVPQTSRR